jgi:hypothetical protein
MEAFQRVQIIMVAAGYLWAGCPRSSQNLREKVGNPNSGKVVMPFAVQDQEADLRVARQAKYEKTKA